MFTESAVTGSLTSVTRDCALRPMMIYKRQQTVTGWHLESIDAESGFLLWF